MSANTEEAEHWTSATIQQQQELDFLTAKYDDICARYGDTSEQALRLKNEIDDLSASFERDKQTIDEFVAECDSVVQANDNMVSAYYNSVTAQRDSEVQSLALIQRLSDLSSKTQRTEADTQAMNAIISDLNSTYSDLNLTLDDVLSNSGDAVGSLKEMAQAEAEAQLEQQQFVNYVDAYTRLSATEDEITKATAEKEQAQKRLNEAQAAYNDLVEKSMGWDGSITGNVDHSKEADELAKAREEYEKATGAVDDLNASKEKTTSILSEIEQGWEQQAEAARQAAEGTTEAAISEEEMVSEVWGSIRSDLEALCASYDEAYDHALGSIEGQYDLWEKAADLSNVTKDDLNNMMDDLNSALDSQINYWETYSSSIENLSGRNIDGLSAMVASMDDGSEKSAAALQAMANASDDELQAMVAKYGDLQSAQQQTASDTAALKTNFNSELDAMQAKMEETVSKMNDSGGAASAAKSTMSAYISELKSKGNEAVSEAQSIAARISAALSKAKASAPRGNTMSVTGEATGTISAQDDVFLAGEEGPELIVGHKGAMVFPAGETDRIIDAISQRKDVAPKSATPEISLTGYDSAISSLSATVSAATQSIPDALEQAVSEVKQRESVQTGADTSRFGSLIDNLLTGFSGAFSATADGISDNAFDKLEDSITAVSAFATGTTNAPDAYIAGDEGPELILGATGSEVFPTGETDRLIDALTPSDASDTLTGETAPLRTEGLSRASQNTSDGQQAAGGAAERRIVIEIAGSGAISIDGGASTEEIVRVMQDNLEPVLIGILQENIFEEGDESYEF